MDSEPQCPVCKQMAWKSYATKRYHPARPETSEYLQARLEVLFKIWFPQMEHVELESVGCAVCGFFCYRPRPQAADLDDKYAYLNKHEQTGMETVKPRRSDARRADDLYRYVSRFKPAQSRSILDYGGGNGRLLARFIHDGYECSVIDYIDRTIAGVEYVGPTPEPLAGSRAYDIITCSHVLEHLASPVEMLRALLTLLNEDGILYIEVPSEIWVRPPPKIDPVTHINFFTTDSLRTCIELSGLEVISCQYAPFTRPNGLVGSAIKAVARRGSNRAVTTIEYCGLREVNRLLRTGPLHKALRIVRHPRMLSNLWRRPEIP